MKDNGFSQIFKLMQENPDLPVIPVVCQDVVGRDDSYQYWYGSWGTCHVMEYLIDEWYGEGCIRYKGFCRMNELIEGCAEIKFGDCDNDENWKKAEEYIASLWKKAIVVYIESPEVLSNE